MDRHTCRYNRDIHACRHTNRHICITQTCIIYRHVYITYRDTCIHNIETDRCTHADIHNVHKLPIIKSPGEQGQSGQLPCSTFVSFEGAVGESWRLGLGFLCMCRASVQHLPSFPRVAELDSFCIPLQTWHRCTWRVF